jgi:hypothetical protein
MSDQDLKRLSDLAKNKRKAGVTREQALKSFMAIGIMDEKGEFTKPYAILESVIKKS